LSRFRGLKSWGVAPDATRKKILPDRDGSAAALLAELLGVAVASAGKQAGPVVSGAPGRQNPDQTRPGDRGRATDQTRPGDQTRPTRPGRAGADRATGPGMKKPDPPEMEGPGARALGAFNGGRKSAR